MRDARTVVATCAKLKLAMLMQRWPVNVSYRYLMAAKTTRMAAISWLDQIPRRRHDRAGTLR